MHKKYNTQNFVKGLKPFISSLPQGIKKNLKKFNNNQGVFVGEKLRDKLKVVNLFLKRNSNWWRKQ